MNLIKHRLFSTSSMVFILFLSGMICVKLSIRCQRLKIVFGCFSTDYSGYHMVVSAMGLGYLGILLK